MRHPNQRARGTGRTARMIDDIVETARQLERGAVYVVAGLGGVELRMRSLPPTDNAAEAFRRMNLYGSATIEVPLARRLGDV